MDNARIKNYKFKIMLVKTHVATVEAIIQIKKTQKERALMREISEITGIKSPKIDQIISRLIKLGIVEAHQRAGKRVFTVNQGAYAKALISPKRAYTSTKITKEMIAKKQGISRTWLYELEKRKRLDSLQK